MAHVTLFNRKTFMSLFTDIAIISVVQSINMSLFSIAFVFIGS